MNMKKCFFFLLLLGAVSSCDSGDIYPPEPEFGRDIDVILTVEGVATIPSPREGTSKYERKLALMYYKDSDIKSTPVVSLIKVGDIADNTSKNITIKNANKQAGAVVLAILGENNEIIYNFGKKNVVESEGKTTLDWDSKVNLQSYNRVQAQLFDMSCTSCHGSNGAKGLSLTSAKSYNAIVNKNSKTDLSKKLVNPNDALNSMIYMRLVNEYVGDDGYTDHRNFTSLKDNDIDLLKEWVNAGAKK